MTMSVLHLEATYWAYDPFELQDAFFRDWGRFWMKECEIDDRFHQ